MIGVVEFQIGDQTQPGAELHQRAIALIGLGYQQFAAAMVTIAAEGRHHAADHGGGILAGGRQQGGHQGAGGGFAVAAGHGDGGLAVDQGSQHIGAVAHGQSEAADLQQFRIAGRYGRADHHQRRLGGSAADGGHRGRVLFPEHPHAQLAQLVHHLALARIRPTHRVAPLGQDPGQGRHADAPHTDEVERLVAIKRGDQGRLRSREEGQRREDGMLTVGKLDPMGRLATPARNELQSPSPVTAPAAQAPLVAQGQPDCRLAISV